MFILNLGEVFLPCPPPSLQNMQRCEALECKIFSFIKMQEGDKFFNCDDEMVFSSRWGWYITVIKFQGLKSTKSVEFKVMVGNFGLEKYF